MELLNQFEKWYPEINKMAKELRGSKIEKKACISGMFVDDCIINIIPYHSVPSLVLIRYTDLSFLLFIAANKYFKKLFGCTFAITPKGIL